MGFPNLVAIAFAFRLMRSVLLGTQALLIAVVPLFPRQHLVDKAGCETYFFVLPSLYERYQFVQCGPSVSPKHPTNQRLKVVLPVRFCRSVIDPRSMYTVFSSSNNHVVRHLLCGGVPATSQGRV